MLVVITGPSGVGKTTVIEALLKSDKNVVYSTSLTTRKPRPGEVDGVDYHFVSTEDFLEKIKNDEFAEWSEVYGKYYGRLKKDLESSADNKDILVGIDVQGAKKLKKKYPEGIFIFLLPRSESALEKQLRGRRTDDEESIRVRLQAALQEMKQANDFNYTVVNNKIHQTVEEVKSILMSERS